MSKSKRAQGGRLLAALGCGAALLVSACGSDNEGKDLPKSSVDQLQSSLDSIQRRFQQGDGACRDITEGNDTDVAAVRSKIDALPASVDKDVRSALEDSFQKLFDQVKQECANTNTETETTPTQTTPTVTERPRTVTETVPTQTTPTQTTTTPGNQGNGNGKGKGKKGPGDGGGDSGGGGAQAPGGG